MNLFQFCPHGICREKCAILVQYINLQNKDACKTLVNEVFQNSVACLVAIPFAAKTLFNRSEYMC